MNDSQLIAVLASIVLQASPLIIAVLSLIHISEPTRPY